MSSGPLPLHPPTPRSICSRLIPDYHPIRTNMKTHPAVSHTSRPEESPTPPPSEMSISSCAERTGLGRSQVGGRLAKERGLSRLEMGTQAGRARIPFIHHRQFMSSSGPPAA